MAAEIALKDKYGDVKAIALIDEEDIPLVSKYNWWMTTNGYVENKNSTLLHNLILSCKMVDHIDGNKLDNRKSNLRKCTKAQNAVNSKIRSTNTSGYRGLWWRDSRKRWVARIMVDGKHLWLGSFKKKTDAAKAYNDAAVKYFGEFARLNKI
jgi:hypothetical protein